MNPPTGLVDLSVIIVNWNGRGFLDGCLRSLEPGTVARSLEVIVVDNASSDGSPELIAREFPWVQLVRLTGNVGFARGNNIGIARAKGRYVCLLNSDVVVLGPALDRLAVYLDAHPEVGMVTPKVLNADRSIQIQCRQFPNLWNNFCRWSGLSRLFPEWRWFSGEEMKWFKHDTIRRIDAAAGCAWMVRRAAFDEVGVLDDQFFMYAEDVDWCRRCWRAGWQVHFFPEAQIVHYGGASSSKAPARFTLEMQRAVLQYWRKHHGPLTCFCFRSMLALRLSLEMAIAAPGVLAARFRPSAPAASFDLGWKRLRLLFGKGSTLS